MLRYLAVGPRSLGDFPMPPHKRLNWEFFAVIKGRCASFFHRDERMPVLTSTLWLFPPGFVHGWIGEKGRECEVIVLHFNAVPEAIERLVTDNGYVTTPLTAADARRLVLLANSLKRHYWKPVLASDIYTERALMDLSLLLMRKSKLGQKPYQSGLKLSKIVLAENWLREHLNEKPLLSDAARGVGISPSHLRRLCWEVRRTSPKQLFDKLRFEKAMTMMAQSNAKLETIAAECGFSSASNFCRAFKGFNGYSPAAWRKTIFIRYKKPNIKAKDDYSRHGRRSRLM